MRANNRASAAGAPRVQAPLSSGAADTRRPFFGWVIVVAVFVILTVSSGLGFYNLTVYLRALTQEHGFAVGTVSGPTGVFFLAAGVSGIVIARLLDRFSARTIMAVGAAVAGVTLVALGWADTVWRVYVIYTVLGLSLGGVSLVPGTTVLTRWFFRRRSMAIAVASAGLSLGGIVVTPLTANLISRYGLQSVTPWLGALMIVVIVPVVLLVIRDSPASVGLRPDGDPEDLAAPTRNEGAVARVAFRSRFFLGMVAGYFLVQLGAVGGIAHHFNMVSSRADEAVGALAVSSLAAASMFGRLLGGWMLSFTSMRLFLFLMVGLQATGLGLLGVTSDPRALLGASVVFGASVGNLLMMETLLIAEVFGVRDYARIFSVQQLLVRVGVALGPVVLGVLFDLRGNYGFSYLVVTGLTMVGMVLLWFAGPVRPWDFSGAEGRTGSRGRPGP